MTIRPEDLKNTPSMFDALEGMSPREVVEELLRIAFHTFTDEEIDRIELQGKGKARPQGESSE